MFGVKTGHTDDAGWSEVAAARSHGVTVYATLLGGATRDGRNADLAALLTWGLTRYRTVHVIDAGARIRDGEGAVRKARARARLAAAGDTDRPRRPAAPRARVAPAVVSLPVTKGAAPRRGSGLRGRRPDRQDAARGLSVDLEARPGRPRGLVREADAPSTVGWVVGLVIVTVTLNAAIDRTLTVPELPARAAAPGERRAHAGRRQGHQRRPRAEAARRARRRHRARGRPHRHADHRGADRRGDPERLRADRRRVADVDRGRRPDERVVHGDQRVGAARRSPTSSRCCSTSFATSRAGRTSSSLPARSRAASSRTSTRR